MKRKIRLNEAQVHRIIKESVKKVLNEMQKSQTFRFRPQYEGEDDETYKKEWEKAFDWDNIEGDTECGWHHMTKDFYPKKLFFYAIWYIIAKGKNAFFRPS